MRTDHIHMVNIDDASRTHTKRKMMLMKTPDLQAARTAVAASAACWQLGDRRVCRWRHRPRRGSDLRVGCIALAPLGGSPRGARPAGRPGRHRIRRSSPPPCAASSSVKPRCHRRGTPCACGRKQAGRRVGRQVKWTSERRSRARIRGADRAQGWKKAGGCAGGRIHAARDGPGARS